MSVIASIPFLAIGLLMGSPEGARRTLIAGDLSRSEVVLTRIDTDGIGVRDAKGVARAIPHNEVLAIFQRDRPRPSATLPALSLTDGQRLVGAIERSTSPEDSIALNHPLLGPMRVPMDLISSLVMPDMPGAEIASSDDALLLANGDAVTGFVVEIGPDVVIEDDTGAARTIALDDIASVHVANTRTAPAGAMVWLADGTVVSAVFPRAPEAGLVAVEPVLRNIDATEGAASEAQDRSQPMTVIDNVIAWVPEAGRLVPLASLRIERVDAQAPRPWTDAPAFGDPARSVLGAPEILMPGPCTVVWTLPARADGFTCEVSLPEAFRDWGDCQISISASVEADGGKPVEKWRGRLNAEQPAATIAFGLPRGTRTLVVAVEAGALGPVQDRPTLASALVRLASD